MEIIIVAVISRNGVIGREGTIPWHIKEELQHFKAVTMGYPIIMGRKTFDSIKKPLKGRLNVIVTRDQKYTSGFPEVKIIHDLKSALDLCRNEGSDKTFIIGGGEIYKEAINIASSLPLSIMKFETDGDTYFPEINKSNWEKVSEDDNELFTVVKYIRKTINQHN